jgi:hypothetical protein
MFRVEWEPEASDQFAEISMLHADRWHDINAADNDIDKKLQRDPLFYSDAVSEGLNRIITDPLIVYFSVDGNTVTVDGVRWLES